MDLYAKMKTGVHPQVDDSQATASFSTDSGGAMGQEATGEAGGGQQWVTLELLVRDPAFDLQKAVCSHGLFMMAPNHWDPATKSLYRPLRLFSSSSHSVPVRISHPFPPPPRPILITVFGVDSLSSQDQQYILDQVRRMLRISEENDGAIEEFHKVHDDARERGFGRIFRSPSLFEDMVKCILLCNCQWPRTLAMARALCDFQQEQMRCSVVEDLCPNTPQVKELKRKMGKRMKAALKLENKLAYDDIVGKAAAKSAVSRDSKALCLLQQEQSINGCTSAMHHSSIYIGNFPIPEELATLDEKFLAQRCKLGYRAQRIVSLARSVVNGKLDLKILEDKCISSALPTYDELDMMLSNISGFGPFTRANVLMCMGFYHRIPADTETVRHLKQYHGISCTNQSVHEDVEKVYGKYAPCQFLAYWSELWNDYEQRFGKLSQIPASNYQLITASNMRSRKAHRKMIS